MPYFSVFVSAVELLTRGVAMSMRIISFAGLPQGVRNYYPDPAVQVKCHCRSVRTPKAERYYVTYKGKTTVFAMQPTGAFCPLNEDGEPIEMEPVTTKPKKQLEDPKYCPDCGTLTMEHLETTKPDAGGEYKQLYTCTECETIVYVIRSS